MAIAAGIGATFSDAAPTGTWLVDLFFRFALAGIVTIAASRARRWTWLALAGFAALGSPTGWALVASAAAVVVAVAGSFVDRRRITGALVGALAIQGIFRLPDMGFVGSSAVFAAIAVLPVAISAYLQLGRGKRRMTHRVIFVVAGVWVLGAAVFGLSVAFGWSAANSGVAQAKEGLAAVGDSRPDEAVELFNRSEASLDHARSMATAWWTAPSKLVPVIAQQSQAFATVTRGGAELAKSAGRAARDADVQALRYESGSINLELVEAAQEPTADVVARLDSVTRDLDALSSPWLMGPVRTRIGQLGDEVENALDQARLAQLAVDNLPGLLGGNEERTYLVLFTQPAEARGLGGFVGSWAELTATDGRMELTRTGRARDINDAPGRDEWSLSGPTEYLERYGKFQPARYFQDITFSPDFASVARVAAEVYQQAGGAAPDGVIAVDPTGLAALLALTGPIRVPDSDVTLNSENAAKFLMVDQYVDFAAGELDSETERAIREDFLDEAGRLTFEKLVGTSLPSPRRLGSVLGPAVAGRHLMVQAFQGDEQRLFDAMGASGEIQRADGSDFLAVVTQNKGNNKIDAYMERSIEYVVSFDPVTGLTTGRVTIEISNKASPSSLPEAVIGSNDQGLPPGTNMSYLSLYTPLRLESASVNDEPVNLEFQREFGFAVYSRFVEIPPGETTSVVIDLKGNLSVGPIYRLGVLAQPLPNPDMLSVSVKPESGSSVLRADGLGVVSGGMRAAGSIRLERNTGFEVEMTEG